MFHERPKDVKYKPNEVRVGGEGCLTFGHFLTVIASGGQSETFFKPVQGHLHKFWGKNNPTAPPHPELGKYWTEHRQGYFTPAS